MMKAKRVFVQPIMKQLFENLDTSDSQEPPTAVGFGDHQRAFGDTGNGGEQSPCTPTEGPGFHFNDNIFSTPKLCPPTPTKTPATTTLKPNTNTKSSSLKTPLFDSESEESDSGDENKFVIRSPVHFKHHSAHQSSSRPNRFKIQPTPSKTPFHINNNRSPLAPVSTFTTTSTTTANPNMLFMEPTPPSIKPQQHSKAHRDFSLISPMVNKNSSHKQQQHSSSFANRSNAKPNFVLLAQKNDEDDDELTPPGLSKKRPFDAIQSPVSTKSSTSGYSSVSSHHHSSGKHSLLGGTPNFNFDEQTMMPPSASSSSSPDSKVVPPPCKKVTSYMDLSGDDFTSPTNNHIATRPPPSTIKQSTAASTASPMASMNWFASPTVSNQALETPIIETTPPSPILFSNSSSQQATSSFFQSLAESKRLTKHNPATSPILGKSSTTPQDIFHSCKSVSDFDYDAIVDGSDGMLSDDDNASLEDFNDMQSQMQPSTPPRATLSQTTSPSMLNIQLVPGRLNVTEEVHENPFSPERNFKKTKPEDDFFSINDDKNTSSYLQGRLTSTVKKSSKKKRQSEVTDASHNVSEVDPIFEVYFSRYLEEFEELGVLGDGCFGKVTKAKNRFDGMCYAIKTMKRKIKGSKDKDKILKEVQALATLVDNPYLVRYYSCWIEGKLPQFSLFLQTELCEGGSLARRVGKHVFTEMALIDLMRQLASGLMQMHGQNIVHLDLKPDNIYITCAEEDKPRYKIGDLGLAASSLETLQDVMEGDSRYLAKELLGNENGNIDLTKADIFSLGATIYECAIGRSLPTNGAEWHDIRNGNLKDLPMHYSNMFKEVLLSLMHIDPLRRPSAYHLLQHPIFAQQKLTENELIQTIQHQQNVIIKLKEQEAVLRRKIEELERNSH
ncbi:hypothetical protein C9374_002474 [Naegleria lovaniensis]|uniref:Protein kinase domain-containing protein n=1 Tax=Naegleria lovaniensis TaxID=51637 RepID=A0AA88GTR1_NAELO|nr:uncharacterized protein C9374_002474 [Naegleria lovaniensis]KAG2386730.1 hypothetical protein C9374_002474 [Naegleria lovaniensis]